jgi:hypothetical protein
MMPRYLIAIAIALSATACSGSDEGRYSAEQAQDLAKRFHEALGAGDPVAAAKLTRVPFRYKEAGRIWSDPTTVEKNLAKEIPRIQHLLVGLDRIEAFSRGDLLAGRWPRNRQIPKGRLLAEVQAAGVAENGWLVRVFSEAKAGYLLVLNEEGAGLAVQALEI